MIKKKETGNIFILQFFFGNASNKNPLTSHIVLRAECFKKRVLFFLSFENTIFCENLAFSCLPRLSSCARLLTTLYNYNSNYCIFMFRFFFLSVYIDGPHVLVVLCIQIYRIFRHGKLFQLFSRACYNIFMIFFFKITLTSLMHNRAL